MEEEYRSLFHFALDAELASQQLHNAGANGQTQPGSTKLPGNGGIRLLKSPKNRLLLFFGNADAGVSNRKFDLDLITFATKDVGAHVHLALRGKLDGVAYQIDQDLLEPAG